MKISKFQKFYESITIRDESLIRQLIKDILFDETPEFNIILQVNDLKTKKSQAMHTMDYIVDNGSTVFVCSRMVIYLEFKDFISISDKSNVISSMISGIEMDGYKLLKMTYYEHRGIDRNNPNPKDRTKTIFLKKQNRKYGEPLELDFDEVDTFSSEVDYIKDLLKKTTHETQILGFIFKLPDS